jgi:O-antigen ligase
MSLLTTVGIAATIGLALQRGLRLSHLLIVAALPLWPIAAHAVLATVTSGLSLVELTSEQNRSFLQDETAFGVHGNAFGQYALFAYVLFIGAAEGSKNTLRKFFLATAALATIGIVVSFSRTAWGAWILVTTFWNAKSRGSSKWLVPAVTALVLLMMPEALFQRIGKGLVERDIDLMLSGRLDRMWLPILQEVSIKPFFGQGWGAYMWSDAFKSGLAFQTSTVHNAYIRLLLETGVVGLSLVVSFYFLVWREAAELTKNESDSLARAMLKSSRWLVVAMLVTGVTGDAITPEMIQVYFWYGIGIFLSVRLAAHARVREAPLTPRVAA